MVDSGVKMVLSENKYLYNGKELQDEQLGGVNLDWYAFEFRYYDPALGRFTTMDPIIENFPSHTPYNYAFSNPTTLVDMWGLQGVDPNSYTFIRNSRAKLLTNSKEEYTQELKRFNRDDRIVTVAAAATVGTASLLGAGGLILDAITGLIGSKAASSNNDTPAVEPTESSPNGEPGTYAPDRTLQNDPATGKPVVDEEAQGSPHTQLGTKKSSRGKKETYTQGRELDENGKVVKDVHFTDHDDPDTHPNPHEHVRDPQTGKRGDAQELNKDIKR